ncbi:hypothetical protein LTR99_007507 [Exophiala xenobiotica]|uniref:Glycosyltransferase 2-like domain-containing protein n=1 Tax=Vermiconidia calcicola TaxID=1690605 RepID=A0AAV9Q4K6_9PEZI|nr:hypothetical protein H2202_010774 [Exophiala xenobiotica]KAK5529905.1 hypothetical protein LTR23_010549 [Chaetothyriales sp. CCFEE 6169]KAK5534616.1 hypothetical protein LTR25_006648 [Vermiconidia calcicola]KAK5198244.1 hypothetical protein LTR92_002489 [Exophiala xenobiotica]KAK5228204.1 hypothetical protein LTR72_002087 [Exophiala xenobiotica]
MDPLSLEKSSTADTSSGGGRSFERPRDLSPVQDVETSSQEGDSQKSGRSQRRQHRVQWNHPFKPESGHDPSMMMSARRPSHAVEMRRRMSQSVRRASTAVVDAVQKLDPLTVTAGNPLGLEVNEIRRVSSAGYSQTGFNARRFSRQVSHVDELTKPEDAPIEEKSEEPAERPVVRGGMSEKVEDYEIQRLAAHDDVDLLSRPKRLLYRLCPILVVVTIAAYWIYFALRVRFTLDAESAAHRTYWMAWAFILVELFVSIPMLLHRLWGWHVVGLRKRPRLRVIGDNVPSVDVIITCCGEDDDLVLDTAKAACNVDYPRERFRVVICDDGKSKSLQEMAERTALTQFDNLYYRSRPKYPGVPHHFKAGNLNDAMDYTGTMPGGPANFIAALDADMIPMRDWLRALLPHMLQDPKCSMACPPQLFYNVPKDDPLCQSLDTFVHISEPIKDSMGVAWCTGSGYVLRRAALQSIGGFPVGSLAEDVCCSSMLLGSGWNTAFVHEPLQFGTVPDSLTSHLKQRTRWTIGTVQTSLKLRFSVFGPLVKHMTFPQRLCGFVYTVSSLFTVFLVLSMFTAPIVLVSHGNLVPFTTMNQLKWLIRSNFLTTVLNRINEFISYLPSGYATGQRDARAMMWMAPFHSMSVIRTFLLPKWLGGKVAVFTSSGSQKADLNERNKELRAPVWRRLKVTIWDCQCYLHLIYIAFALAAVGVSIYWNITDAKNDTVKKTLIALLTHAFWPPIIWLTCSLSCWIPINYALFPPSEPDRTELLVRDPVTGVAYPSEESKKTKVTWAAWAFEAQNSFVTVYTTVVFILSFWF